MELFLTFCVFCLINLVVVRAGSATGSVGLDTLTFDKILAKHSKLLVKFDESFAYGDKQDIFEELCNKTGKIPELLIGEVQTSDYGLKKNQDLEARFGITKEDRPAYRLFLDHNDEPIKYKSAISLSGLASFLFEQLGIRIPLDHCLPEFDQLAERFMKETDEVARKAIIKEAEGAIDGLKSKDDEKSASVYVKMMDKILEKGQDFVTNEIGRVSKLAESKVTDKKKAAFQARLNILTSFKSAVVVKDEL